MVLIRVNFDPIQELQGGVLSFKTMVGLIMVLTLYDPSSLRTSHYPILQYMGVKTKKRGPGPFYMYYHINDADVYLGGWEGGVTNRNNTMCLCSLS